MNNKNIIILVGVVVLVGSFFTGYYFGKNSSSKFTNGNFVRGGVMMNGSNTNGRAFMQGGRSGTGFVVGQVLSKDANSLTVKLRDGGSRIVFYLASTTVSKMSSASINDIVTGSEINVTGSTNSDGSINASSIQEIPARVNN